MRWRTAHRRRRRPSWAEWALRPRYLGVVNGCYVFVTNKRLAADIEKFAAEFDAEMRSAIADAASVLAGDKPEQLTSPSAGEA